LKSYIVNLKSNGNPGIIHFFSGTKDHAEKLLEMGFSFTFGGVITFVNDYDGVVKMIPIGRILTETDAPYVTPTPYRGKRNEPLYVEEVAKRIAVIKGLSFEEVAQKTVGNTKRIFDFL
ncbi:MAG: TatD family hydrolase, partial [Candidatus Niyogibacteria bacterium]|nr:TatD family hydrolase [Candidatus Niyogibacteria bacterium]